MRKLLAALVVLAVIVVGADVAGRLYAEHRVQQALAQQLPGRADPAVRIHGFSFLLQAFAGRYTNVTISGAGVPSGPLKDVSVALDLTDIDYPLRDAIAGTTRGLTVGQAGLRLVISAQDLAAALGLPDLTLSSAGGAGIRFATSVSVAGTAIPVAADVTIRMADGRLRLSAGAVSADGARVPSAVVGDLTRRLTTSIPVPQFAIHVTSGAVSLSDGSVVITATATDLTADQVASLAG